MTNKPMLSVERDSIALEALKVARQFIANGIELGFISMPEPETPDPAHDTLPMIDRAIAELKAAQHQGGVTLEQVIKAYDYANSHPHKYLRGTTNWCAAVAHALNVQHPAPVAGHTQCEECKGWGYHENHHEGGGTECGECGGSGNATVAVMPDVDELAQIIRKVDGSHTLGAGSLAEAILEEVARLNGVKP